MSIKFNSVKCPECGATLQIEEGRNKIFCSYCGSQVVITNENEYTYRHIDEARVKQAETDRMVRMREMNIKEEKSSAHKFLIGLWISLSVIIVVVCLINFVFSDGLNGFLIMFYVGGPVIGGGAYLIFKLIPEKENEKILLQNGGIRFPKSLEPFSELNYQAAETILKNIGFTNISCVNMHDITIGLIQKPDKIESITVNGEKILRAGKVYRADSFIVITYHGK